MENTHECYVRVLVWDPFRDLLISGGGDGWVRLWSTEDYDLEDEINTRHSVRSLLVLTKELATGHNNGEVQIWDMEKPGKPRVQKLKAHRECVYALAMLRSGELVTGAENIRVFVRHGPDFELAQTIREEILCACAVPCRSGDSQVVTGNMKGFIHVWDAGPNRQWRVAANCDGHTRSVWALCFVREAKLVASGSADHMIRLWSVETWECEFELRQHTGWVVGLSYGPGWLLSCSIDQTVRAWDVERWACARTFSDHNYEVYTVCAFAGGRFAAGGAEMAIAVFGGPSDDAATAARRRQEEEQQRRSAAEADRPSDEPPEDSPELRQRRKELLAKKDLDMTLGGYRDQIHFHIHGEAREKTPRSGGKGVGGGFGFGMEDGGGPPAQPVATAAFGGGSSRGGTPPQRSQPAYDDARGGTPPRARGAYDDARGGTPPRGRGQPQERPSGALADRAQGTPPRPRPEQSHHQRIPQPAPQQRHMPQDHVPPAAAAAADDDDDILFETRQAIPRVAVEDLQAKAAPKYTVGSAASVYSASQHQWLRARVIKVEGGVVTVSYAFPDGGEAQKQLLVDSEQLRPADARSADNEQQRSQPAAARGGGREGGGVTDWSSATR